MKERQWKRKSKVKREREKPRERERLRERDKKRNKERKSIGLILRVFLDPGAGIKVFLSFKGEKRLR